GRLRGSRRRHAGHRPGPRRTRPARGTALMALPLVGAEALHLEYPTRVVLDSVTLGVHEGDRIGVVGRNGDGKSSLMGVLAGTIEPQSGRVTRRGGVSFGVLAQSDDLDAAATVGHAIVGDRPEHEWRSEEHTSELQ